MTAHATDLFAALSDEAPLASPPSQVSRGELAAERFRQADATHAALDRDLSEYLHFPFPAVDALVGGMVPGRPWYVVAFSGNGKTAFLMSALDAWATQGVKVYYVGLESRPWMLIAQWACVRLGVHPGDALSGELKKRAVLYGDEAAQRQREALAQEVDRLTRETSELVQFSGEEVMSYDALKRATFAAKDFGADVVVIDHIDHTDGDGGDVWAASVEVNRLLPRVSDRFGLRLVVASQLNNEACKGDKLARYHAPQPHHVWMGAVKRQVAAGMLGLYRPMKLSGVTRDELVAVRHGEQEAKQLLEPNTMGVALMKHWLYGEREGDTAYLGIARGAITELSDDARRALEARQHGINTGGLRV